MCFMCHLKLQEGQLVVCQFQFLRWSAYRDVPDSKKAFLNLLAQVHKWQRECGEGRTVVHCLWVNFMHCELKDLEEKREIHLLSLKTVLWLEISCWRYKYKMAPHHQVYYPPEQLLWLCLISAMFGTMSFNAKYFCMVVFCVIVNIVANYKWICYVKV